MNSYTFTLTIEQSNTLVNFAKTFSNVNGGYYTQFVQLAKCRRDGNSLDITTFNKSSLAKLKFDVSDSDIPDGAEFFIKVPTTKFKKNDVYVTITASENETTYKTHNSTQSIQFELTATYPKVDRIVDTQPNATLKIAFDPKLLANTLKAFDGDYVEFEFSNSVSGAFITSADKSEMAFILPVKLQK